MNKKSILIKEWIIIILILITIFFFIMSLYMDVLLIYILFIVFAVIFMIYLFLFVVKVDKKEKIEFRNNIESYIKDYRDENYNLNIALLYDMYINKKFDKLKEEISIYLFLNYHEETYEIDIVKDSKTTRLIFDEDSVWIGFGDSIKTDMTTVEYNEFPISFENEDSVINFIKEKYKEM